LGEQCRDCSTDDLSCSDDAICVNPRQLPAGQVDDSSLHIVTTDDARRTRDDLLMRIFGETRLPSLTPTTTTSEVADPFDVAAADVSVERVEIELPGGTTVPFWVMAPASPSGQLVIVHQGHWHSLKEGRLSVIAEEALSTGAIVIGLTMPLFGESTGPVSTHDELIASFPEALPGHGIQLFLTPVSTAIHYTSERYAIDEIAMVGISGGGWTTLLYSALDPRVQLSIPIAGGEPLYQRSDLDWGDREQTDNHLYEVAGYLDLHLLAAIEPGRHQHAVLHRYDTCCFAGTGYQDWEPTVQDQLEALSGGSFQVFLDESFRGHEVSPHTLAALVSPLLAGDAVRYFDDTLPAYGSFQTTGEWVRDASSGFGSDSARSNSGQASWRVTLPVGPWSAALTWVDAPELGSNIEVEITVGDESQTITIDQTRPPSEALDAGALWQTIASGSTDVATELHVELSVPSGSEVRADALRVEARWTP